MELKTGDKIPIMRSGKPQVGKVIYINTRHRMVTVQYADGRIESFKLSDSGKSIIGEGQHDTKRDRIGA